MVYANSTIWLITVVFVCCFRSTIAKGSADYREYIANSGSTVTFKCYKTHDPYTNVTWWRNDSNKFVAQKGLNYQSFSKNYSNRVHFDEESKNLMIFDCQGSDNGFYFCETMHKHKKLRGGFYNFIVEEKPKCKRIVSDINVINGTSAFLPCEARGTPKPIYQWHKVVDKQLVNLDSRFAVSNVGLSIRNVTLEDAGSYRVKLVNRVDTFYNDVQLYVRTLDSISPQNYISAHQGSDANLNCEKSTRNKGTVIEWINSEGDDAILLDRFSSLKNGTLQIKRVQLSDDGLYTCKMRTKVGDGIFTKSVLIYLNVQYPPVITRIKPDVKVYKNSHVLMLCSSKGNPNPRPRWILPDGTVIKSNKKHEILSNGSMVVRNVQLSDVMKYTCAPYNAIGEARPSFTQLLVIVPPYFLSEYVGKIHARLGDNIQFNCTAGGLPKPSTSWKSLKASGPIGNKRKTMNAAGLLSIENVQRSDSGTYVCLAQSVAGETRRKHQLVILDSPRVPTEFFVTTYNGSMHFAWKPANDGGAKQTFELWYRATYKTDYQWSTVGVISDNYEIRADVTNTAGRHVSFYCSLRSENSEGYSNFTYVIKTSKLLPHGKRLSSTILEAPLSATPLSPYGFTLVISSDGYGLQWKYLLTPGRPVCDKFVIEYREKNSTSGWKTFTPKERVARSLNTAKGKKNLVNIKIEDIPGVQHPLEFQISSVSFTNVKSKPAVPIVRDMSKGVKVVIAKSSIDAKLIPPIVMGVIFGLFTIILIIALYCYCERKKKRLVIKESKMNLVANDNNNIMMDGNSSELRDTSKLILSENNDFPTRYHLSICPALKLGENSQSEGHADEVFTLLQPNAEENSVCTCNKKYVRLDSEEKLKTLDKKGSLYRSSSLPSVLFTSDVDVSSVDPSEILEESDFGIIDLQKDNNGNLDKDTKSKLQRGCIFRDSLDKFCRSETVDAACTPSTKIHDTNKMNLLKLAEAVAPLLEKENIRRRRCSDDGQNPETKSLKSNKSLDRKSSGFGDGESSTSDPDSIGVDTFEIPRIMNKETSSHFLTANSKKDTGYFSDVPTRASPLFTGNHKIHPTQKHKSGNSCKHTEYFSEDDSAVPRLPYRPLQPPSYNQAIIDMGRMSECSDITDSENMCKQLLEMERKMGVKLDDSIEMNLDKNILDPPCRFQNSSYRDTGYMSDVSSTLKTRYTNREKNARCAQLLSEFKNNRQPSNQLNLTEELPAEEDIALPGHTPKHTSRSVTPIEDESEEATHSLKRSNSTNSSIFNEWLV